MDKRRTGIIRSVRTPLGFFTLTVLVVEAIMGIMTNFTSGSDRTILIVGILIIILLLIIIVAVMAWKRPHRLYGRAKDEVGGVRADVVFTPTKRKEYDQLFRGFANSDLYAFNPPFKVEGEPGDARFEAALKAHETRYRSGVTSHYLFFDRESYGRAQVFFHNLEQRLGKDKLQEAVKVRLWEKAPQAPGYTFFIGHKYKEKRPSCILYPSATMRGGLPDAVILLEGEEHLLSIMHRYFQESWEQAKPK